MTMLCHGVRLTIRSLALCVASSAGARGNLNQGKTAAQLYASACATCHKSPQSVFTTKRFFGLETFLREHYTSSSDSAAILAAYLKAQGKPSAESQRSRAAKQTGQARSAEPTPSAKLYHPNRDEFAWCSVLFDLLTALLAQSEPILMSAIEGKADIARTCCDLRL